MLPAVEKMTRKRQVVVKTLMDRVPGRFSTELGLRLDRRRPNDLFLWFLAAIFFGGRISGTIATRTHKEFVKRGLVTPKRILRTGWDGLVEVLDAGGYARYDFKTATKLLEVMNTLVTQYQGDLNRLHQAASDSRDLEQRLKALGKGIGEVTVQIFLRELRGIWSKAEPPVSPLAILASEHLHLMERRLAASPSSQIQELKQRWKACGVKPFTFHDFEAALVRLGRDYCRRQRWQTCPMGEYCGGMPANSQLVA